MSGQIRLLIHIGIVNGCLEIACNACPIAYCIPIAFRFTVYLIITQIVGFQIIQISFDTTKDNAPCSRLRLTGNNLLIIICQAFPNPIPGIIRCLGFQWYNIRLFEFFKCRFFCRTGWKQILLAQNKHLQTQITILFHIHDSFVTFIFISCCIIGKSVFHDKTVYKALQHTIITSSKNISRCAMRDWHATTIHILLPEKNFGITTHIFFRKHLEIWIPANNPRYVFRIGQTGIIGQSNIISHLFRCFHSLIQKEIDFIIHVRGEIGMYSLTRPGCIPRHTPCSLMILFKRSLIQSNARLYQ